MKTIVFAHPWNGSFNKAILDKVVEKLDETKEKYTIIDLNKDKFNPVMTEEELSLYSQGKSIDPLVEKCQEILKIQMNWYLYFQFGGCQCLQY